MILKEHLKRVVLLRWCYRWCYRHFIVYPKKWYYRHFVYKEKKIKDIFDYREVLKVREDKDYSHKMENGSYGITYILKRHAGIKSSKPIQALIEHGMLVGLFTNGEWNDDNQKTFCTYAKYRADKIFNEKGKIPFNIGPLIQYAKCICDEFELNAIKDNLGKTLLIYPMHSNVGDWQKSDIASFISMVKKIKSDYKFQTILVSIYYADFPRGLHIPYLQEGWQVVSPGDGRNYDYLDIQRTLMTISDAVYLQGFSTALPFALSLGKPGAIYNMKDDDVNKYYMMDRSSNKKQPMQYYDIGYEALFQKFEELFSEFGDTITSEQLEFCNKYFGFRDMKTSEEIRAIINFCSELQRGHKDAKHVAAKKKYKLIYKDIEEYIN